ncbi:hypothetical protein SYJ56_00930 [Algoriphagus sp. D3-2-R+10]|uniref:hypothetical protein n=1 Tax=Algoriphagus aurantiacus TaxID=3103948 RepID=UPI002B3E0B3D|nr:hypothetical protein [Algoriphagus sp. D3-2-R+10]MEB2773849.1 hypothetical protein [Algoriphagus sp. D3-2-R+10]
MRFPKILAIEDKPELAELILLILSIWSAIIYINMLDEIHVSIDYGPDNYLILLQSRKNSIHWGKNSCSSS